MVGQCGYKKALGVSRRKFSLSVSEALVYCWPIFPAPSRPFHILGEVRVNWHAVSWKTCCSLLAAIDPHLSPASSYSKPTIFLLFTRPRLIWIGLDDDTFHPFGRHFVVNIPADPSSIGLDKFDREPEISVSSQAFYKVTNSPLRTRHIFGHTH